MITLENLFKKEPLFLDDFSDKNSVLESFEYSELEKPNISQEEYEKGLKDVNILFAYYLYEDYTGEAFVLFHKDGKLFEVNGSHCSCYGLESQWLPDEVDLKSLHHRITKGDMGNYHESLKKFLEIK